MSQGTTIYVFEIELSDTDRNVYESIKLNVAQHPSETIDYLLTRVLAYCMEYREGLELTKGLSDPDLPALWAHDLTGALTDWIEIGAPSAERVHRASKKAPRVAIYTYKDTEVILDNLRGEKIQHASKIALFGFERKFLDRLASAVTRRNVWELSVQEKRIYLNSEGKTFECSVSTHYLAEERGEFLR